MSYTKGPWSMETVETSNGSCHKIGPFPSGRDWRPETHACVYADGFRLGVDDNLSVAIELRANANLIAAAPDMAEALRACMSAFGGEYEAQTEAYKKARAALAKAGL